MTCLTCEISAVYSQLSGKPRSVMLVMLISQEFVEF